MTSFEGERPLVEKRETDFKNVTAIETANADYRIMYTQHNFVSNPKIVEGSDGIVLEFVGGEYNEKGVKETTDWMQENKFSPYKELLSEAARKHVPIFLTDLSFLTKNSNEFIKTNLTDDLKIILENALGIVGIIKSVKVLFEENLSRRDFLKKTAMLAGSMYASLDFLELLTKEIDTQDMNKEINEGSFLRKAEKVIDSVKYNIHPETRSALIDARNDLIAQKSEFIAKTLSGGLGKKPKLSIVIGASHVGLERSFNRKGGQRIEFIKSKLGSNTANERFIARIDFSEEENKKLAANVTFMQDPDLHS